MSNEKGSGGRRVLLYKFVLLAVVLTASACNANHQKEQNPMTVDVNTLRVSPVVHDTLSAAQLEKIKFIHQTFAEVQPGTLEGTITDFKRDQNPDNEIAIWLNMATAYQQFVQKKGATLDTDCKKEAFKLILLRSYLSSKEAVAQAKPKLLSPADVADILGFYDHAPEPLKVSSPE